MSHKSILPYVGGKQQVVRRLARYFPEKPLALGSPFIGGGSLEVYMAARGVRVFAADACWELVDFWQVLLTEPEALAERLRSKMPIAYPLDPYRQKLRACPDDPVETACLFYILILCGFSHILARESGGSPKSTAKHNKYPRGMLERVRQFACPNLSVERLDCFDFLDRYPELPLYCDPPYANAGDRLYGFSEDLHTYFPHEAWAKALKAHKAFWVQSYGDCELIWDLYADCVIDTESWKYGSTNAMGNELKVGQELVIRPPGSPPLSVLAEQRKRRRAEQVSAMRSLRIARDASFLE